VLCQNYTTIWGDVKCDNVAITGDYVNKWELCYSSRYGIIGCPNRGIISRAEVLKEKVMDKFWELLEKSTIVSGLLAVSVVGAVIYLSVTAQPVSEVLVGAMFTIIGFFFGSKLQQAANAATIR